jgi:hypothetical protein
MALAAPALAQDAAARDFAGEYEMQGKGFGPRDTAYGGTCSIRHGEPGYQVSCFNRDTRHTYTGKGLAAGDTLSIFIGDHLRGDHNRSFVGEYLVVYRRRSDGVLKGTWVHAETAAAGSETLTLAR